MADRPNTTCDHYGFDRATMSPTCALGHLGDMRAARRRGCVRSSLGHPFDRGRTEPCPDRDDSGQEARDAEVIRVTDAITSGICPNCDKPIDVEENDETSIMRCPRCPDVFVIGCKRAGGPAEPGEGE